MCCNDRKWHKWGTSFVSYRRWNRSRYFRHGRVQECKRCIPTWWQFCLSLPFSETLEKRDWESKTLPPIFYHSQPKRFHHSPHISSYNWCKSVLANTTYMAQLHSRLVCYNLFCIWPSSQRAYEITPLHQPKQSHSKELGESYNCEVNLHGCHYLCVHLLRATYHIWTCIIASGGLYHSI